MRTSRSWIAIFCMTVLCILTGISYAHASSGQQQKDELVDGGSLDEAAAIITIKQVQGKELDLSNTGLSLYFVPRQLIEGQSATKITKEKLCGKGSAPVPLILAIPLEIINKVDCAVTKPVSYLSPIGIRKQVKSITYRKSAPDRWEIAIPLESLPQIPGDYRLESATFLGGELDGIGVAIDGAASGAHENEPQCYPSFLRGTPNVNSASPLILMQARYQGKESSGLTFSASTYLPGEDQVYSDQSLTPRSSYRPRSPNRSVAVSNDCSRIVIDPLLDKPSLRPNSFTSKSLYWRDAWSEYGGKLDDELSEMNEELSRFQKEHPEAMILTKGSLKIVQLPEEFFTQKKSGWSDRHRRGRLPALSARMLFKLDELVAVSVHSYVLGLDNEPALRDDPEGYANRRKNALWGSFSFDTNAREKYYFFNRQLHEKMEVGGDHDGDKKGGREQYVLKNGEVVAYMKDGRKDGDAYRSAWYSHLAAVDPAYSHNAPPQTANADLLADQAMWWKAARQYGHVVKSPDVKAALSAAEKGDVTVLRVSGR